MFSLFHRTWSFASSFKKCKTSSTSPHRKTHPLSTPPISNKNLFLSVCFRNLSENMRGEVFVTSIFCCFVLPVIQSLCLGLPSIHFIKFFFIFRGRKRKWIFWPKINNKNSVWMFCGLLYFPLFIINIESFMSFSQLVGKVRFVNLSIIREKLRVIP